MRYRLIETTAGREYREYRVEMDDAAASAAYTWLEANNPQFRGTITTPTGGRVKIDRNGPFWARVAARLRAIRPQHADETGHWAYVDGEWRAYEHGETLMSLYAEVIARLVTAIPTPYRCAGAADGCPAKVAVRGAYCASCAHDDV